MKEIDDTHIPKMTGSIEPADTPVTDRISPDAMVFIRGLVIVILTLLALMFIGNGALP